MKKISIIFYYNKALKLFHDPLYESGGAARQVLTWFQGLQSIGVKTMLMGATANSRYNNKNPNIIISYNQNKGIRKLRFFYIRIPLIFIRIYRSKADYLYYPIPAGLESGLLAIISKILGKKFILRISNDFYTDQLHKSNCNRIKYFYHLTGLRLADYILCQNGYQYEKMKKKYPKTTFILSNPYSGKITKSLTSLKKRNHIAWVGILSYKKYIPLLLEIAKKLSDIPFKIAGSYSNKLDENSKLALNELKKLSNIEFLGYLKKEDVLKLLEKSFCLLNTSHYEGFPNTYLEAFSVGTPVFTLKQNDPNNIIYVNKLGEVYKNADDFVIKFTNFIKLQEEYNLTSMNCINYMKKNHDLIKQSNEFLKIITAN